MKDAPNDPHDTRDAGASATPASLAFKERQRNENINPNSGTCDPSYTCPDGCKNGTETDVDCGGASSCPTLCDVGQVCEMHGDCITFYCHPVTKVCS